MTGLTQAISSALLDFVWQGVAVAFLLWMALALLRRRSADKRYAACSAAMAILVLLPLATCALRYDQAAAAPAATGPSFFFVPAARAAGFTMRTPESWLALARDWALPVWSMGVLFFSLRLVWGCRQVARLRRRGALAAESVTTLVENLAARMGIARAVRVLIAGDGESPSVVGWLRPVVLVPSAALLGLTVGQLEAVLAHELAHIRRHDYLVNLLQMLAETLLFYHPVVWWVSGRMRQERELCCDDLAVRSCGNAVCYARALATLERMRVTAPALAMGSNGGSMLHRIQRLLGAGQDYAPSKLPGVVALVLALGCFALNLHWARGQEPQVQVRAPEGRVFTFQGKTFALSSDSAAPSDSPGVTVDLGGATVARRTGIEYPGFAIERHIDGTVVAEVTLDGNGSVTDARIVSGPQELRRIVLRSVLEWRYTPAYANGVLQVRVQFQSAQAAVESVQRRAKSEHEQAELRAREEQLQASKAGQDTEQQAQLQEQVQALRDKIDELKAARQDGPPDEQARQLELQMRELKRQAERSHLATEQAQGTAGADQASAQLAETQTRLSQEAERLQKLQAEGQGLHPLPGCRLKSINFFRLSEAAVNALQGQLPVHLGDVLTEDSIAAVERAVKQFDSSLEVQYTVIARTNQAELRILGPGRK